MVLATQDSVNQGLALKAPLASPALTGIPTAPTAPANTNILQLANTAFVSALAGAGRTTETVKGVADAVVSTNAALTEHLTPYAQYNNLRKRPNGANWIIEGDIRACFDSFDHHVLIDILRRRIQDEHFISLMWKFLKAGYIENWERHSTYSGSPQGSGASPILANIYFSELERYMEDKKLAFDKGKSNRNATREYWRVHSAFRIQTMFIFTTLDS